MTQSDAGSVRAHANRPIVSALEEQDLPEAGRILRLAFGTFLGAPDPESFWSDWDYVESRARAVHIASSTLSANSRMLAAPANIQPCLQLLTRNPDPRVG